MRISLVQKHFSASPSRDVTRPPSRLTPGSVASAQAPFTFLFGAIVH